jgi:sulfur relay (sulfurtransferase) complex TusBCD TusD component (DsrE family)
MVSEAPYASLKPYTALRYAVSARKRGLETVVIFFADGVFCVKRGVGRDSETVGDFEAKVHGLMKEGVEVQACSAPMRLYCLTEEDLIEGVTVAEDVIAHTLDENTEVIWL